MLFCGARNKLFLCSWLFRCRTLSGSPRPKSFKKIHFIKNIRQHDMRNGRYEGKQGRLFTWYKCSVDNSRAPQSMECAANVSHITRPLAGRQAGRRPLRVVCELCVRCHRLKIPPLYKVDVWFFAKDFSKAIPCLLIALRNQPQKQPQSHIIVSQFTSAWLLEHTNLFLNAVNVLGMSWCSVLDFSTSRQVMARMLPAMFFLKIMLPLLDWFNGLSAFGR